MQKKDKMKTVVLWLLSILVVFYFYGTAFGYGGGPEDPACPAGTPADPLPEPTAGQFLSGEFTVSRVTGVIGDTTYSVHIKLKRFRKRHLFSFQSTLGDGDLCARTSDELEEAFKSIPCTLGVAEAFELEGIPVITHLMIIQKDSCNTLAEMIRGWVVLRVVPQ